MNFVNVCTEHGEQLRVNFDQVVYYEIEPETNNTIIHFSIIPGQKQSITVIEDVDTLDAILKTKDEA